MEPVDLGVPQAPAPRPLGGPPQVRDPDEGAWQQFTQATTPEVFYRAWLTLQCRMIRGVASGVLVIGNADGAYVPAAFWPPDRHDVKHLAEIAERSLGEGRGVVRRREPESDDEGPAGERYQLAYPVQVDTVPAGVVALEILARPERELQAALHELQWGAAWLEILARRGSAAREAQTRARLQTALELVGVALQQGRFYAGASSLVTELATRLDCDRVSVGFVAKGRIHVRAVSHSADVRTQTNLMRALAAAMDEALDQQATVVHPPLPGRPAQVTRAHEAAVAQQGGGAICSMPLSAGGEVVGVITLERAADRPFDVAALELGEAVAALAGPVLELQRRDDRWLGEKALESGRRLLEALAGPRHAGLKLGAVLAASAVLFLVLARGEYRVTARTVIEAAVQRTVPAPFKGFLAEARARAGDVVAAGQLLARLDDREVRLERLRADSQAQQQQRQYQQALAARDAAQVRILAAQIDQTRAELALLDDQLSRTSVTAPFDGVIIAGDLSQALGAPVDVGQQLFQIAPLHAYRIILETDERDVAEVHVGQRGSLVLTAFPGSPLPFVVEKMTPVSQAREGRNFFRVEARLDRPSDRLRPGMEGVGKIDVDRRRLVWIWTHQIVDWLRLKVWSWTP